MIQLNVSYGVEPEVKRVAQTLKKIDWYHEKGYKPILPYGVKTGDSLETIMNTVSLEYDAKEYAAFATQLLQRWNERAPFVEKLEHSTLKVKSEYTVMLTKYGVGGSYDASTDSIILNMKPRPFDDVVGTVLHEIVHIAIEPLIQLHDVSHWRKERLVDLLGNSLFPELKKMQLITEDVSIVDEKYDTFYPDIEAVIRTIAV